MTMSKKETFVRTDDNREQILKRDNYTCKMCNENTKDDIDVYQINTTRSTSILINLVTLCKSCYVLIKEDEEKQERIIRNEIVSKSNKKRYKEIKQEYRSFLKQGFKSFEEAHKRMNIMVEILAEDNPDWSIKKIAKQIIIESEGIIGFKSIQTIYNNLNEKNRELVDPKYHHKSKQPPAIKYDGLTLYHPAPIENHPIYTEIQKSSEDQNLTEEEKEEKASKLLPEDIYDYAKEREISAEKKLMIANPRLAKHPELQERLIDNIVTKTNNESKIRVAQEIRDLETGAITKIGDEYHFDETSRERIEKNAVAKPPRESYLNLNRAIHNLCKELTNYKLDPKKGDFHYNEKHFKYSSEHREEILNSITSPRGLLALSNDLVLLSNEMDEFVQMIRRKMDSIDRSPNIGGY